MYKVESMEHYKILLTESQNGHKGMVSNSYMFLGEIQRYIDLGRFYYEKLENGIVFYSDEESHYRCYLHVDTVGTAKKIEKKDKILLAQLLYRGNKGAKEQRMSARLEEVGFSLRDTMDYITVDVSQCIKKIEPRLKYIYRLLDEEHLTFRTLLPDELDQLLEFQNNIDHIPYYQIVYHSPEEYRELIRENRLECIVDWEGNLCAVHFSNTGNSRGEGWLAIKEAYRRAYGIILLFSYSGMKRVKKNGIKRANAWVLRDNTESIKYHRKLGYIWENRVMEEWLLGD